MLHLFLILNVLFIDVTKILVWNELNVQDPET